MRGALLRSGKIEDFDALGEAGTPVHRVAEQLRDAVRRKNPDLVIHLAIPRINQAGDSIDWYAPQSGPVIPWSASTEEERIPARAQMEILKAELQTISTRLLASNADAPDSDTTLFAKLLNRVPYFPDESYVYLVDGSPVVTFWGFDHAGSNRARNPLLCLYSAQPTPAPAAVPITPAAPIATAVVASTPWWKRWWWLLLLLPLLLLLLLGGLKACAPVGSLPSTGSLGWPSWLPFKASMPGLPMISPTIPRSSGTLNPTLSSSESGGAPLIDSAPLLPEAVVPDTNVMSQDLDPPPLVDGATDEAAPPTIDDTTPGPPDLVSPPPLDATAPLAANTPPDALNLPPNLPNGPADFLNGAWRAGAGIQDAQTGRPLRLEYQFQDGKGQVTVTRGDASCQGPVSAAMQAGALQINPDGQALCSDGGQYELPNILCSPGAATTADCTGNYGNMHFPLSMRQATN